MSIWVRARACSIRYAVLAAQTRIQAHTRSCKGALPSYLIPAIVQDPKCHDAASSLLITSSRCFSASAKVKKKEVQGKQQEKSTAKDADGPRLNEAIKATFVRLVTEKGHQVVPIHDALNYAKKLDLDLVEVQGHADPPVCKVMDYNNEKFKQQKKEKERAKIELTLRKSEPREIRFTSKTEIKDLERKAKTAIELMERGYRIKCLAMVKGNENVEEMLKNLLSMMEDVAVLETSIRVEKRSAYFIVKHIKFTSKKTGTHGCSKPARNSEEIENDISTEVHVKNNVIKKPIQPTESNQQFEDTSFIPKLDQTSSVDLFDTSSISFNSAKSVKHGNLESSKLTVDRSSPENLETASMYELSENKFRIASNSEPAKHMTDFPNDTPNRAVERINVTKTLKHDDALENSVPNTGFLRYPTPSQNQKPPSINLVENILEKSLQANLKDFTSGSEAEIQNSPVMEPNIKHYSVEKEKKRFADILSKVTESSPEQAVLNRPYIASANDRFQTNFQSRIASNRKAFPLNEVEDTVLSNASSSLRNSSLKEKGDFRGLLSAPSQRNLNSRYEYQQTNFDNHKFMQSSRYGPLAQPDAASRVPHHGNVGQFKPPAQNVNDVQTQVQFGARTDSRGFNNGFGLDRQFRSNDSNNSARNENDRGVHDVMSKHSSNQNGVSEGPSGHGKFNQVTNVSIPTSLSPKVAAVEQPRKSGGSHWGVFSKPKGELSEQQNILSSSVDGSPSITNRYQAQRANRNIGIGRQTVEQISKQSSDSVTPEAPKSRFGIFSMKPLAKDDNCNEEPDGH